MKSVKGHTFIILLLLSASCADATSDTGQPAPEMKGRIVVSENKRFLQHEDGTPFFYLADTAWEFFHRLDYQEAERYLENRRQKGFNVVQAVLLAELDGLNTPNANGDRPLLDNDPTRPNEKYFAYADSLIRLAATKGIYVAVLPTWGDKWNKKWGVGPEVFTPENAETFGKYLGEHYKAFPNIIWILGGDRPLEQEVHGQIIRAMARGLRQGDQGAHLMTFHPAGGQGSSQYFHHDDWLDFNLRQNGHGASFNGAYANTLADYEKNPVKPVIDGEPIYEDHPIEFRPDELGHSTSADVRRALYWNLFSGACGHTYGHHSVWQMWQPGREPVNRPLMPWYEAIDQPGAEQMQYGRRLMESRPYLSRIPDNSMIVPAKVTSSVPGNGRYRFVATRDQEGAYAMVYAPVGRAFTVRMDVIKGNEVVAWWYNPRNGEATRIGTFPNRDARTFISPDKGENLDWVLVLDDASKSYPPPGTAPENQR